MDYSTLVVFAIILGKLLIWIIPIAFLLGVARGWLDYRARQSAANLEHMTNFHYYDYSDRYYNYAQRQWILK